MTDQIKIWSRTYAHSNPVNYTDSSGYMSLPDITTALSVRIYDGINYSYYVVLLHQTLTTTKSGQIVTQIGIELVELLFEEDITFKDVAIAFIAGLVSAGFNIDLNLDEFIKNISEEEAVSDETQSIIKNFDVEQIWKIEEKKHHIFSKKHMDSGIMNLGNNKTEREIFDSIVNIVKKVDSENLAQKGSNQIHLMMNGHRATIRFFIDEEGTVRSLNAFYGSTNSIIGNLIDLL